MVVPSPALSLVLDGDFADQLGAQVLEAVSQFDFLGHRDAVLGGGAESAKGLLDDHIAALGTERHLDRIGQGVDAAQQAIRSRASEAK